MHRSMQTFSEIPCDQVTPMMQQYADLCDKIRKIAPSAIVLFEVGDFYEMFFQDAIAASKALELVLTSKIVTKNGDRAPLCGIPIHAINRYRAQLVAAGFTVATVNQGAIRSKTQLTPRYLSRIVAPE